ncbi:hypothetical protein MTO96_010390 [Rhipicephalus appendiculatus]
MRSAAWAGSPASHAAERPRRLIVPVWSVRPGHSEGRAVVSQQRPPGELQKVRARFRERLQSAEAEEDRFAASDDHAVLSLSERCAPRLVAARDGGSTVHPVIGADDPPLTS